MATLVFIALAYSVLFAALFGLVFSPLRSESTSSNTFLAVLVPSWLAGALSVALVWRRTTSPELPFFDGLATIASSLMSGCFPLTVVYIFPILMIVYSLAILNAWVSLVKGKAYASTRWIALVSWFSRRSLRS